MKNRNKLIVGALASLSLSKCSPQTGPTQEQIAQIEKRNRQNQQFVEDCSKVFGDYVFLLEYRINGHDFKPEIPESKAEELAETKARFESYKKQLQKWEELDRKYGKTEWGEELNPLHHLKNLIWAVEHHYITNNWSYFSTSKLKIAIGTQNTDKDTVAEEFIHSMSMLQMGGIERLLNLSSRYYNLEEKITQSTNQEDIRLYRKMQKDLKFQSKLIIMLTEGHKVARLSEMTEKAPKAPRPELSEFLVERGKLLANLLLLAPSAHFLNRANMPHATSDTFFEKVIGMTDRSVADVIWNNPPESVEEWKDLDLYFAKIQNELEPNHYKTLAENAEEIKKECKSASIVCDGVLAVFGLLGFTFFYYPLYKGLYAGGRFIMNRGGKQDEK